MCGSLQCCMAQITDKGWYQVGNIHYLGTNPRFLRITWNASGATFTWQADPNKSYCLQFTSDLRYPAWQTLGTYSAANGLITFTDQNANGSPQVFYRLQEGQCPQ